MNPKPAALEVASCQLQGISLIEASAGTGKTWNLCNLYLRLLLERDLEAQQILVVTFTNAATAELRERVRARLAAALEHLAGRAPEDPLVPRLVDGAARAGARTPAQLRQRLETALDCFDEAAIHTIHAFCQRALADTPLASGLPYDLELIEDDAELRREAAADFWRRKVAGAQCDPDLAAQLAAKRDSPGEWARLLERLQAKPLSRALWPQDLDAPAQALRPVLEAGFAAAREIWRRDRAGAIAALRLAESNARAWDAWFESGDPLQRDAEVETGKNPARTAQRHRFIGAARELLSLRAAMLEQLARLRLRLLRDMAMEAGARLRAAKRERRVVSFDDIVYNAWDALCNGRQPSLAGELRRRYPVALIDEFQDTDPLQCAIFLAIYDRPDAGGARGPLFFVGDPKQAIYSFRNADLHSYLQAKRHAGIHHTLIANQRSVAGLIEACNALFAANPGGFILPGIEYRAVHPGDKERPAFADESEPAAAPLRVWRLPRDGAGRYLLRERVKEIAAQATAAEISRLLREASAGRIRVGGRALRGGDIAVLVRSHRQGSAMKLALGALGIDSVELSRDSVFAARDAEELSQVLAAILEPAHAGRLLAALATQPMGASAQEIEALARDDAALARRTARFDELRRAWLGRGFGVMFREWLDGEGVSRRLLARADGERRLTNLLQLGELLQRASQERPAPDALLRWFATQRSEAAAGEEAQLRLESDRNLVQIVTIHKAKGLEYGIVFCPFLWDGFRQMRGEPYAIEYHDDDGRGVIDFRPGAANAPEVWSRRRDESAAEDVRLAYVALTRAVHRCYLIAGCYLYKSGRGEPSPRQSAKSLLNWLAAGAGSSYAQWAAHRLEPEEIEAAWKRIADAARPHILLADLPLERGTPLGAVPQAPENFNALPAPERIDRGWRIASFTALTAGAKHEAAASDHDARALPAEGSPPEELPANDILRFPRGPAAGDCVHAVFERADFTDAASWDAAISHALALHPQRGAGSAPHREMLHGMLEDVLAAELPRGIVLGRVPKERRLDELGFSLPAAGVDPARLNRWLRTHGYPMPRLAFDALRGYLRGYIDCVFEHAGRYYVLDWKSNHLGYAPEDYSGERLAGAMRAHGYHLQHLLYAVALHRYLGQRLADYDYERHFGGAVYVFVRGVRPGRGDAGGAPNGVWFHRAPATTLASLDALLAGGPEALAA